MSVLTILIVSSPAFADGYDEAEKYTEQVLAPALTGSVWGAAPTKDTLSENDFEGVWIIGSGGCKGDLYKMGFKQDRFDHRYSAEAKLDGGSAVTGPIADIGFAAVDAAKVYDILASGVSFVTFHHLGRGRFGIDQAAVNAVRTDIDFPSHLEKSVALFEKGKVKEAQQELDGNIPSSCPVDLPAQASSGNQASAKPDQSTGSAENKSAQAKSSAASSP